LFLGFLEIGVYGVWVGAYTHYDGGGEGHLFFEDVTCAESCEDSELRYHGLVYFGIHYREDFYTSMTQLLVAPHAKIRQRCRIRARIYAFLIPLHCRLLLTRTQQSIANVSCSFSGMRYPDFLVDEN
jgi:hypothetical protein